MSEHSETFSLFAFVAFVLMICWLAISSLVQGGENPEGADENVIPSLEDLVVGDAVLVMGIRPVILIPWSVPSPPRIEAAFG